MAIKCWCPYDPCTLFMIILLELLNDTRWLLIAH